MLFGENQYGIKLDPRTKLLLLLTVMVVTLSGRFSGVHLILRIICTATPFLLLLNIRRYKTAMIYIAVLGTAIGCEVYVIPRINGGLNIFLVLICGLVSRFISGYMMGMYAVQSTSVSEFITAMEMMHTPRMVTIPMSVMFRYFPTITEENRAIRDAMKMREIGGSVKNPFVYAEYVLVPVMMSAVRIADELSAASLTKGLSVDGKRTHICQIELRWVDLLLMLLSVSVLVLFFIY